MLIERSAIDFVALRLDQSLIFERRARLLSLDNTEVLQHFEHHHVPLVPTLEEVTTIISGQTMENIPVRLWSLSTGGALFYIPNPEEYRKLQQVIGPLRGVSYEVVKEMGLGEALLWSVWVNDARYRGRVVHGHLRPSCVRAGGETKSFR